MKQKVKRGSLVESLYNKQLDTRSNPLHIAGQKSGVLFSRANETEGLWIDPEADPGPHPSCLLTLGGLVENRLEAANRGILLMQGMHVSALFLALASLATPAFQ